MSVGVATEQLQDWAKLRAVDDMLRAERLAEDAARRYHGGGPSVRAASEIVELAKELKRLGVKHFKDDSMELSFEREMKRPERPEGEF